MAEMRADSGRFYQPWHINDLRGAAERYGDLAEDLHLIKAGLGPLPEDLLHAPQIDEWRVTQRRYEVLEGTASDHPVLITGDHIRTSLAACLGQDRKWARTLSRYYRLSNPAADPGGQISTNCTVKH